MLLLLLLPPPIKFLPSPLSIEDMEEALPALLAIVVGRGGCLDGSLSYRWLLLLLLLLLVPLDIIRPNKPPCPFSLPPLDASADADPGIGIDDAEKLEAASGPALPPLAMRCSKNRLRALVSFSSINACFCGEGAGTTIPLCCLEGED